MAWVVTNSLGQVVFTSKFEGGALTDAAMRDDGDGPYTVHEQ